MERIKHGNVLMTIDDENKQEALELAKRFANIGYGIYATKGTADLFEAEGLYVHRACMTSLDTANALAKVLEPLSFSMVSMNEMGK